MHACLIACAFFFCLFAGFCYEGRVPLQIVRVDHPYGWSYGAYLGPTNYGDVRD